jgi:hypothetical protein
LVIATVKRREIDADQAIRDTLSAPDQACTKSTDYASIVVEGSKYSTHIVSRGNFDFDQIKRNMHGIEEHRGKRSAPNRSEIFVGEDDQVSCRLPARSGFGFGYRRGRRTAVRDAPPPPLLTPKPKR